MPTPVRKLDESATRGEPFAAVRSRLGGEARALLRLAIPVVLSELAWMMMSFVDTIMVGRLSPEAIGAVGLSSSVYYIPTLFGVGLLLGLDTLVSQAHGRGDRADCRHSLIQGIYIALAFSVPVMAIVEWLPATLPYWGTNPAIIPQTAAYLRLLNWGTPWLLVYACLRRYLQGMHIVKPVTFALVTANLVNLAGNWLLIYGRFGLPAMGVRGSALSTVAARIYMAAFLAAVAFWHERHRGAAIFATFPLPDRHRILEILRLGGPAATQMIFEIGAFGAATVIAARLSAEALAAHQVALNIASITYMVPLGISAAAAIAVGHAVGAGDPSRARRAGWLAIGLAAAFMALMAIVLIALPRAIILIYSPDPRVMAVGVPLLALAAAFQIFDGIQTASTGALRGLGHTTGPMVLNFIGYWIIGLPLGYWLCFHAKLGVYGVWIGLTLSLIFIALLILIEWTRKSTEAKRAGMAGNSQRPFVERH
jgi:MATE family multidrug resistance protein